jgi:hypothetical protein
LGEEGGRAVRKAEAGFSCGFFEGRCGEEERWAEAWFEGVFLDGLAVEVVGEDGVRAIRVGEEGVRGEGEEGC